MPKYYNFKVCGYYLYFTAHCIIECMHVHASDSKLTEGGSQNSSLKAMEIPSYRTGELFPIRSCELSRALLSSIIGRCTLLGRP